MAIVATVFVAAISVAWGNSESFYARINHPVVYEGQSFPTGRIEMVSVGNGDLFSLRLDNRRVALLFSHKLGKHRSGDVPVFYFRVTDQGLELIDICWSGETPRTRVEVLTVVVRGHRGRLPAA